ncbi:MAG: DnaD domain protein [Chloroflexota bacterium]|nr:DnaD domain protein [Chloroflexota bacterium]
MTGHPFQGFPRGTRYTPVPNALLGPLLAEIDDMAEFKCILRAIALLHRVRGYPRCVGASALLADAALVAAFKDAPGGAQAAIAAGLERAVARGVLLRVQLDGGRGEVYLLNTEADRRAASRLGRDGCVSALLEGDRQPVPEPVGPRENIFALYEENIGMLTPLLAEELKEAEASYPPDWIRDAFREAVERNKRSWSYIRRILERWATEGRGEHGEHGRHPEEVDRKEYLRRYGPLARP